MFTASKGFSGYWIYSGVVSALYLLIGIGAWQENGAAVRMGVGVFGVFAVMRLGTLLLNFSWSKIGMAILFAYLSWEYWVSLKAMREAEALGADDGDGGGDGENDEEDTPMISLVLLLSEPKYLDEKVLGGILETAWGGDYTSGDEDRQDGFVVGGDGVPFLVKSPQGVFLIHNWPSRYPDISDETIEGWRELRTRKALEDHQAWLSVDLLNGASQAFSGEPRNPEDFYPAIIRLIVELADDKALALFRPETGQISVWSDDVFEKLVRPRGLSEFNQQDDPVWRIESEDPQMEAAVAEAKRRWPEFAAAFAGRAEGDSFLVKAPVTAGGNTEFIWIDPIGMEPEVLHGRLLNQPVDLGDLREGSQVEVPVEDIIDWAFRVGEGRASDCSPKDRPGLGVAGLR
ncbi:MAG: DUF2314 domain-containing protein [Verrucomicrobiales bacterium]